MGVARREYRFLVQAHVDLGNKACKNKLTGSTLSSSVKTEPFNSGAFPLLRRGKAMKNRYSLLHYQFHDHPDMYIREEVVFYKIHF